MTATGRPGLLAVPPPSRVLPTWTWAAVGLAVWIGALAHRPGPWIIPAGMVAVAITARRVSLLVLAVALLGSTLGAAAFAGLHPVSPGGFRGVVTLVGDPQPTPWGTAVDVRAGRRRFLAQASGSAAGGLADAAAGERFLLEGVQHAPPPHASWLISRRIVGVVSVRRVDIRSTGSLPYQVANQVRAVMVRGAASFDPATRALFLGFVLGDDRGQRPEIVDDFRGSGLSHVLVVSGQNLAFALVLVRPLLRRVSPAVQLSVTLLVLFGFGLLTRFEPSVLRALAMALVAVGGAAVGRPLSPLQRVGAAVAALVLIDPLLVFSVGFRLSVAASVGLAVLAEPIAARLAGPRWWREGVAVTVAAQVGVAPILIPMFGGLPVVAVPANLVAEPLAALVTTWGLPAGFLAGVLGGRAAVLLHLPTWFGVAGVAAVARVGARVPLGSVDGPHALALLAIVGAVMAARALSDLGHRIGVTRMAAGAMALVLVQPAWLLAHPPPISHPLPGLTVERGGGATVVRAEAWPPTLDLMAALRGIGVRRIDLLIGPGPVSTDVRAALEHRWPLGRTGDNGASPVERLRIGDRVVTVGEDSRIGRGP